MDYKEYIAHLATSFKTELAGLAVLMLAFISPILGLFALVVFGVFLDTAFGVYVSVKLNGWKSFDFYKLLNSLVKISFYACTILMGLIISVNITDGALFGVKLFTPKFVASYWTFRELKSVDNNSQKLGNRPFIEMLTSILEFAKEIKKDITELKK